MNLKMLAIAVLSATEWSFALKATLVIGVGLIAAGALSRARATLRHAVLASTFGVLLFLPAGAIVLPRVVLPVAADMRVTHFEAGANSRNVQDVGQAVVTDTQVIQPVAHHAMSMLTVVRTVWALGVVVCLGPLLVTVWKVCRVRRGARAWPTGQTALGRLGTTSELHRRVTVRLAADVVVPMTCGVLRPAIVLPDDARAWPTAEVGQALAHELEHVRRVDWLIHLLARMTCALYWFHPLVWIAWRQLALESERACDDAVLEEADPHDYAQQLAAVQKQTAQI